MPHSRPDRRRERSRQALLDAFIVLVLSKPYEEITPQMIARSAGLARSTLYAHFSGKAAILAASLAGPLSILADTVGPEDNGPRLTALLEHFWMHRSRARTTIAGGLRHRAVALLAQLILKRLRSYPARTATGLPAKLAAIQLAEALFAPVVAWLQGEAKCETGELARALRRCAVALTRPRPELALTDS